MITLSLIVTSAREKIATSSLEVAFTVLLAMDTPVLPKTAG